MPTYFDAAAVERARVLVETTPRTLEDIAVEIGASVQTLRNWIMKHGWRRHPQAPRAVPKLPPEKEEPARRVYENRAGVGDLAVLLGCHESWIHRLAKQRGWTRRPAAGRDEDEASPPSEELLAIADGLRDPRLTRGGLIQLIERLAALTLLEAFTCPGAELERRERLIQRLARLAHVWPEDVGR